MGVGGGEGGERRVGMKVEDEVDDSWRRGVGVWVGVRVEREGSV